MEGGNMTELLITSKIPGRLIYWRVPMGSVTQEQYDSDAFQRKYSGQTFKAPVTAPLGLITVKIKREGSPGDLIIKLYKVGADGLPSEFLKDLKTIPESEIATTTQEYTFDVSDTSPVLNSGEKYAIVFYTSNYSNKTSDLRRYHYGRYYAGGSGNVYPDGDPVVSDNGTSWYKYTNSDWYFKLRFGKTRINVEDLGYSEAYILRVEYLENGTQIVVDDEITFAGDAGEIDDMPTTILVPFKKAEWKSGQVKMYGVGIP